MTPARLVLAALAALAALVLQTAVVARLPLPGAPPDLVLVVVVAVALARGPRAGMATGFLAGCLADLLSDHALGRLALAYVVVGFLAGRVPAADRDARVPFTAVGTGALVALLLYAGEGLLLGDPRVGLAAVSLGIVSSVPYAVALTPFVVPAVGLLLQPRREGVLRR